MLLEAIQVEQLQWRTQIGGYGGRSGWRVGWGTLTYLAFPGPWVCSYFTTFLPDAGFQRCSPAASNHSSLFLPYALSPKHLPKRKSQNKVLLLTKSSYWRSRSLTIWAILHHKLYIISTKPFTLSPKPAAPSPPLPTWNELHSKQLTPLVLDPQSRPGWQPWQVFPITVICAMQERGQHHFMRYPTVKPRSVGKSWRDTSVSSETKLLPGECVFRAPGILQRHRLSLHGSWVKLKHCISKRVV